MNYFEFHLGDYAQATAHLNFIEDAAYMRLLRKYYASETALPADLKQVQRLVGARTKEEKTAVEAMLEEYFALDDDGWHNTRCDEEIEKYRLKLEAQAGRREGVNNRQARSRALRKGQIAELRKHGIKVPWNIPSDELQALLSRVTGGDSHGPVTADSSDLSRERSRLSQSPVPSPHTPSTRGEKSGACVTGTRTGDGERTEGNHPESPVSSEPEPPAAPPDDHARWLEVRAAYPIGTYRQSHWLIAEREARDAVQQGITTWGAWLACVERYAAQWRACGSSTQHTTSPQKFFGRDARSWNEPFPLPTKQTRPPTATTGRSLSTSQIEADIAAGLRDTDGAWIGPSRENFA